MRHEGKAEAIVSFATPIEWEEWLAAHHASAQPVRLRLAKKATSSSRLSYAEAVDVALCWGWIDGRKEKHDDVSWLQRFSRRTKTSPWSKINRDKAERLIREQRMRAPGLAEIERARRDGRWDRAYDSPKTARAPDDFMAALRGNKRALAFYERLDATNRYAILFRLQTAKKEETRQRRIAHFVLQLARGETLYPPRKRRGS